MLEFIFLEVKTGACVNPLATKIFNTAKDFVSNQVYNGRYNQIRWVQGIKNAYKHFAKF